MNIIDLVDQIARKVVPPSSGFSGKLENLYRRAQGKYEAITENSDHPEWKKKFKFQFLENEILIYVLIFSFNRVSNSLINWGANKPEQPRTLAELSQDDDEEEF